MHLSTKMSMTLPSPLRVTLHGFTTTPLPPCLGQVTMPPSQAYPLCVMPMREMLREETLGGLGASAPSASWSLEKEIKGREMREKRRWHSQNPKCVLI